MTSDHRPQTATVLSTTAIVRSSSDLKVFCLPLVKGFLEIFASEKLKTLERVQNRSEDRWI